MSGVKIERVVMTFVFAAVTMVFAAHAGDGVHFVYKYEEGASFAHKVKFSQEVEYGSFSYSQFMDMEVTEKCVGVREDGTFQMEMTFNKVESSKMQFDNMVEDKTADNLVGRSLGYLVDGQGDVSDVKSLGYIENWEAMAENMNTVINLWYAYLPDEEIPVGGGWEGETGGDGDGSGLVMTSNSTFTFEEMKEEIGRKCARVTAKIKNKLNGTNETAMGSFVVDGGGTSEYEIFFDPKGSFIVKMKGKSEMAMDMKPEDGKGNAVETTVSIQLERELM